MVDLNNLDLFTLVDMLAKHTNEYMKMLKDGSTDEEYARCKGMIKNLTAEIEYRKQKTLITTKTRAVKDGNSK